MAPIRPPPDSPTRRIVHRAVVAAEAWRGRATTATASTAAWGVTTAGSHPHGTDLALDARCDNTSVVAAGETLQTPGKVLTN